MKQCNKFDAYKIMCKIDGTVRIDLLLLIALLNGGIPLCCKFLQIMVWIQNRILKLTFLRKLYL